MVKQVIAGMIASIVGPFLFFLACGYSVDHSSLFTFFLTIFFTIWVWVGAAFGYSTRNQPIDTKDPLTIGIILLFVIRFLF